MATKSTPKKAAGTAKKPAAAAKPKKATAAKSGATRKAATREKEVSHDEIVEKAHELYMKRMAKGEPGDPETDWYKAIELLKKK